MFELVDKFCPRCRRKLPHPGSFADTPIRKCPACSQVYFDKDFREPGLYERPKPNWKVEDLVYIRYMLAGLICLFFMVLMVFMWTWHAVFFSLASIPFFLKARGAWLILKDKHQENQRAKNAYKTSLERIRNKQYIRELLDYGYIFPKYYLSAYHPDLTTYQPAQKPNTEDNKIFFF